jgi:2-dehydropantoate 2-reductase
VKIAVIGAGAIGGVVAGYLKLKGEDVTLIGRKAVVEAVTKHGLHVSGCRGDRHIRLDIHTELFFKPDLVILAVKTQDTVGAVGENFPFIKDSLVVSVQNGVRAEGLLAQYFPQEKIISSIIMFGATYLEPGCVVHNFEGNWIIGSMFGSAVSEAVLSTSLVLDKAFTVTVSQELQGMKYLKMFINASNCVPALLGVSMQDAFADLQMSTMSIAIWKEAFEVVSKAGIKLSSLPGFPLENVTRLTAMQGQEAAKVFSGIMVNLSKDPLYGSILQSIMRGKTSEIDYINGEFVRIAEENGGYAPLNKKLVEMVHLVEMTKRFFRKEELLSHVREFTA